MSLMAVAWPTKRPRKRAKTKRPKKIKYLHECPDCRHRRLDTCDFVTRKTNRDCAHKPVWMTTSKGKYKLCGSHKAELMRLTGDREIFVRIQRPRPFA